MTLLVVLRVRAALDNSPSAARLKTLQRLNLVIRHHAIPQAPAVAVLLLPEGSVAYAPRRDSNPKLLG